jgi:hypothetical protein
MGLRATLVRAARKTSTRSFRHRRVEQAATPWEANANLALVLDSGDPMGTNGDQQDDPRLGDVRIGAMPLASGVLAETFLPPPSNGGTAAGDIIFNSTVQWQIGTGFDLQTIAAHEFGHALGLGDTTTDPNAVMYYAYDGIETTFDGDDISGIRSLYGAIQLNKNDSVLYATNITSSIDGNGQIALAGRLLRRRRPDRGRLTRHDSDGAGDHRGRRLARPRPPGGEPLVVRMADHPHDARQLCTDKIAL